MVGPREEKPTDDRSCAERGRDAVTVVADYVTGRLRHYRAAGELAMTFGWPVLQRKIVARVDAALGRPAPPPLDEPTATWPAPGASAPADCERPRANSPSNGAIRRAAPGIPASEVPIEGNGTRAADLAIPGYDSLSASQVVERLTGLPVHDLDEVRGYEATHRNRRTILGKIDQLRSSS